MLALAAVVVALLTLSPALPWPDQYLDLGERFLFPWHVPAPYTLAVQPGNTVVARGRPLHLTVHLHPRNRTVALPASCTLVCTDAAGSNTRLAMSAEWPGVYSVTLDKEQVTGDFRYHIEADTVASATYQVTAIDPVDLVADGVTVTATPPAYAAALVQPQTGHNLTRVVPLQHGQVRFEFRFTRPVRQAVLERSARTDKRPQGSKTDGIQKDELELSPDHGGAHSPPLTVAADGTFACKLLLIDQYGIPNDPLVGALTVKADQPPVFERVASSDRLMEAWQAAEGTTVKKLGSKELNVVQPSESVPLDVSLTDDIAVEGLEVEYRIGQGPPRLEPVPLQGHGTALASARYEFRLDGKVQEGDLVHFRLKATDNRRVPSAHLEPNVAYYPANRWLTVKVARQASTSSEQQVLAERDDIDRRIEAIQRRLGAEHIDLLKLRSWTWSQARLRPDDLKGLSTLRRENREIENELRKLRARSARFPRCSRWPSAPTTSPSRRCCAVKTT